MPDPFSFVCTEKGKQLKRSRMFSKKYLLYFILYSTIYRGNWIVYNYPKIRLSLCKGDLI